MTPAPTIDPTHMRSNHVQCVPNAVPAPVREFLDGMALPQVPAGA